MQMGAQEGDGKAPPGGQVRNCPVPAGPGKAPPKLPALPAQNRQEPQQHREGGPGVQRKGLWIRPRGSECRGASDGWSLGGGVSCALGGVGVLCEGTGPGQRGPGGGGCLSRRCDSLALVLMELKTGATPHPHPLCTESPRRWRHGFYWGVGGPPGVTAAAREWRARAGAPQAGGGLQTGVSAVSADPSSVDATGRGGGGGRGGGAGTGRGGAVQVPRASAASGLWGQRGGGRQSSDLGACPPDSPRAHASPEPHPSAPRAAPSPTGAPTKRLLQALPAPSLLFQGGPSCLAHSPPCRAGTHTFQHPPTRHSPGAHPSGTQALTGPGPRPLAHHPSQRA